MLYLGMVAGIKLAAEMAVDGKVRAASKSLTIDKMTRWLMAPQVVCSHDGIALT